MKRLKWRIRIFFFYILRNSIIFSILLVRWLSGNCLIWFLRGSFKFGTFVKISFNCGNGSWRMTFKDWGRVIFKHLIKPSHNLVVHTFFTIKWVRILLQIKLVKFLYKLTVWIVVRIKRFGIGCCSTSWVNTTAKTSCLNICGNVKHICVAKWMKNGF